MTFPACRFSEFGVDGGPAAKSLRPKFDVFSRHVSAQTGLQVPDVEVRNVFISLLSSSTIGNELIKYLYDAN